MKWTLLPMHGIEEHPRFGRVYLDEDYKRTFRAAVPRGDGYHDEVRKPGARFAIRFRSREAAKMHLVKLHDAASGVSRSKAALTKLVREESQR